MRKFIIFFVLMTLAAALPIARAQDDRFGPSRRILTHVETVEVVALESYPVQLQVVVTGENRDGCDLPVQVRQIRFRNRVWVRIFRIQPEGMMCPAILKPYEETINLHGTFETGVYQIDVNGVTVEFES